MVAYTDVPSVVTELNLQKSTDNPTMYLLYAIPTSEDVISNYVAQANEVTTQMFGDLTGSDQFNLAKIFATKLASLWLIQVMASNIVFSGARLGVGAVTVERLPAIESAFEKLEASLNEQLRRIYIMLTGVEVVDSYSPSSVYIPSRGQTWMP